MNFEEIVSDMKLIIGLFILLRTYTDIQPIYKLVHLTKI